MIYNYNIYTAEGDEPNEIHRHLLASAKTSEAVLDSILPHTRVQCSPLPREHRKAPVAIVFCFLRLLFTQVYT